MPMLLKWLVVILFLHACEAGGGSGRGKKTPTPTTIRSTTTTSTALPLHECFYSCARNHNPRLDCLNWNSSDSCSESANLNDEDCKNSGYIRCRKTCCEEVRRIELFIRTIIQN
ncbi:unnamed protein product [Trichobilharzia szidati]|nr:unnamed protein product [Trichobilharzia szidati]